MTNSAIGLQQNSEPIQRCIGELLEYLLQDYRQTKDERRSLSAALAEDEDEFTVLEELELATADLRGYAGQVQVRGWVEDEAGAIARLQQLRLLGVPAIARFYFEEGDRYPLLKAYALRLDYLRLLVLEFLQMGAGAQSA